MAAKLPNVSWTTYFEGMDKDIAPPKWPALVKNVMLAEPFLHHLRPLLENNQATGAQSRIIFALTFEGEYLKRVDSSSTVTGSSSTPLKAAAGDSELKDPEAASGAARVKLNKSPSRLRKIEVDAGEAKYSVQY